MVIYFGASARNIKEDITTYRTIIRSVQEVGGIMTHDWIESAFSNGIVPREADWWSDMNSQIQLAIHDADFVIIEASHTSTFGVGFELANALSADKPTLALIRVEATKTSYVLGVRHPQLFVRSYTQKSLSFEVKKFLKGEL